MEKHDAFISYSRRDKVFAAALERQLEKFRAPKDLPVRQGYLEIFRDEKDFTGGEYFTALNRHLEASSTLIVICSPNARASAFVNDEIRRFAQMKLADRIVPVLVAGVPNNEATPEREGDKAFPEALCEQLEMPLAVNYLGFDVAKDKFDRGAYTDAWFTLLGNIYRISRSEIEQRERRRRARFIRSVITVTASIIALLIAALVVTLISRAEAVRQAIEARRQTATRLAVQALEKIDTAPETALTLAIDAVETYHSHGDPTVPRAIEALHKTRLSFGGGRPVLPWREDQVELVFSSDLIWAASTGKHGDIRFTRAGSGKVKVLDPPPLLKPGEAWSDDVPALVFAGDRLVAGRPIIAAGDDRPREVALWYWPLVKEGLSESPQMIGRFEQQYANELDLIASVGGRWLSWYGAHQDLLVKDLSSDTPPTVFKSSSELRRIRMFSNDESSLVAAIETGLSVIWLPSIDQSMANRRPEVVATLERSSWQLGESLAMAARSPDARCRDQESQHGLTQTAVLYPNGNVTYWDLSQTPQHEHVLPNLFSAFSNQMKVWWLERDKVRAKLEFRICGQALLATVATKNNEFGLAAHIELTPDASWQPVIVEQLKSMLFDNVSRVSGSLSGPESGYHLTDRKKLGTADATWFIDNTLLTIGIDGSLEFHDLDKSASQYLTGEAVQVAGSYNFSRYGGISTGTRNGQLRIFGKEGTDPVITLSAHDRPVSRLLQDRFAYRVVTIDKAGGARIWETENPVMRPDSFKGVSDDWTRYLQDFRRRIRIWDIGSADPFAEPIGDNAQSESQTYRKTTDGRWRVIRTESDNSKTLTVSLHRIRNGVADESPTYIRTIEPPTDNTDGYWRWKYRGWTHLIGDNVLYLATGHAVHGDGAVLVSLTDGSATPMVVVEPKERLKIEKFTKDFGRLLLSKGDLHSDRAETALEVRGVMAASGKPYLHIEGTRYGMMSDDGRWLLANDILYDMGGEQPVVRAEKAAPHEWRYDVTFSAGRAPLWLDDTGNLWGIDADLGSTAGPRQLVGGFNLHEFAWSDSADWLGLGSVDGKTWVVEIPTNAAFNGLLDALQRVKQETALPAPWDTSAKQEIHRIDLLTSAGWVKAETENHIILLWRGSSTAGWSDPLVFHPGDGLRGHISDFRCRPDGEVCIVGGQLMKFDAAELLMMSKGILTGAPLRP